MLFWLGLLLGIAQEGETDVPDLFRSGTSVPRPQAVEPGGRYNLSQPKFVDRQTVTDLSVGTMDLVHLGLQDNGGDPWAVRGVKWGLSIWFGFASTHVVHEYGHISAMSRAGFSSALMGEVGSPASEREDATVSRLFVQGLWPTIGRALSLSEDDWSELQTRFEGRPEDYNRFWMTVETGGLNQEQILATRYATRLHEDRLSYLDTPGYLWASLATIMYSATVVESDIADYITLLNNEGRDVSASRVKALTGLRFLGGTGVASLRASFLGAFGNAGGYVEPLAVNLGEDVRLFWPELESYLTSSGPTLKAALPVRPGGWMILPSYERSFATGGVEHEAGLRTRAPFLGELLWLEGAIYYSDQGGVWRSAEVELRPLAWLSLLVGAEDGHGYTFRREVFGSRETFMDGSEQSLLLGLRVSLAF